MRFLKSLEITSIWSLPSPTVGSGTTGGGFLAGSAGAGAGCGPGSDIILIRCCSESRVVGARWLCVEVVRCGAQQVVAALL